MKEIITIVVLCFLFTSCKNEVLQEPKKPISKEVMADIMYDLAILEAIKFQNPVSLDTLKINSRDFIFKKYKVDSLQFVENNAYYAANYEEYKQMFDQVTTRLEQKLKATDMLIANKQKKIRAEKLKKLRAKKKVDSTAVKP